MKQVPFKRSLFIALFLACGLSHAADPKMIGEFNDWTAYVYMEGKNKVCYMVSKPKKEEGSYTKRGSVYALLTHRPAENSKNVFSFMAGYPFKKKVKLRLVSVTKTSSFLQRMRLLGLKIVIRITKSRMPFVTAVR